MFRCFCSSSSSSSSSSLHGIFMFLFVALGMLSASSFAHAQNQTTITYTPMRVAVIIDSGNYISMSQYIPGWWMRRILNIGGITGAVPIQMSTYRSVGAATAAWATNITLGNLIANGVPTVDIIVMLCLDTVVPATAGLMEPLGVPVIVPMAPTQALYQCGTNYQTQPPCTKPNTRRYQYAHGIGATSQNYFEPFISLLKIKGGKTLVCLQPVQMAGGPPLPAIYQEFADSVRSLAINNKISITMIPVRFPAPLATDLPAIGSQLLGLGVDALIAFTSCELYLPYFKQIDLNFKAMNIQRCLDGVFTAANNPGVLARYLTGSTQWDPRVTGLDYSEYLGQPISWFPTVDPLNPNSSSTAMVSPMPSPLQFFQFAVAQVNGTAIPDYAMASFAAAFEFLEGAVFNWRVNNEAAYVSAALAARGLNSSGPTNVTLTVDRVSLNKQMQLLYEPSMFGILSTNRYGINQQKPMMAWQRSSQDMNEIISPLSAATLDFIYPMPTWRDRTYVHAMFATTEEVIICVLVAIFSAYTVGLSIVMCIHRASKQIRASSLTFSLMMAMGGIVGYLAVLTWPIENNGSTCSARPWLWCLGFQLFFAPLLAKSYRIASIFNVKKFQRAKHDDKLVTWHTFLIAAPQLLILIIWSVDSPLEVVVRVQDVLRPALNYADCDSARGTTYVWLSVGYSALCLLAGCLLAYRVRAAFEMFNDAKYIANSVYIFTLTAVVIAGVQAGINTASQMNAIFFIRSIGTLVAYGGSVSLLLMPRVIGVIGQSASQVYQTQTKVEDPKSRHDSTGEHRGSSFVGQLPATSNKNHRNSISPSPNATLHVQVNGCDKPEDDHSAMMDAGRRSSTSQGSNLASPPHAKTKQAFT